MRIVLVHGVNNQDNSSEQIVDDWLNTIRVGMDAETYAKIRKADVVAPFYGRELYDWTENRQRRAAPIAQAAADPDSDEAKFYREALEEIAPHLGISEVQIAALSPSSDPVEQGLPHDRRLLALLRAFETISPLRGSLVLRLIPQAFTYLSRPGAAASVDAIVRPHLVDGPFIVIAHSLGTIVTFKLLREEQGAQVPLYLTLGSPLAVRAVKNAIGPRFGRCPRVDRWVNAFDLNDAVTIGRALTPQTFGNGVENIGDVNNGKDDPHSIEMYLRNREVVHALANSLR